jgi:hypothetical protein
MDLHGKPPGIESRILALCGAFGATARQVIAIARHDRVKLERVYDAMIAAASDSTEGDRALAGAAYVIALRAKLSVASDLLNGRVKVDEVSPRDIVGTAEYVSFGIGDRKGDTLYFSSQLNASSLLEQGLVVHELTHAATDRDHARVAGGPPLTQLNEQQNELEGYRAQGLYVLKALKAMAAKDQPAAITQLAAGANNWSILAMMLEDRAANYSYLTFIDQINRASAHGLAPNDWAAAMSDTDPQLNARAIAAIQSVPVYARPTTSVDGLAGESILD